MLLFRFHELKFDLHDMIVVHDMDVHFIKNAVTLSGCDIHTENNINNIHLNYVFKYSIVGK